MLNREVNGNWQFECRIRFRIGLLIFQQSSNRQINSLLSLIKRRTKLACSLLAPVKGENIFTNAKAERTISWLQHFCFQDRLPAFFSNTLCVNELSCKVNLSDQDGKKTKPRQKFSGKRCNLTLSWRVHELSTGIQETSRIRRRDANSVSRRQFRSRNNFWYGLSVNFD